MRFFSSIGNLIGGLKRAAGRVFRLLAGLGLIGVLVVAFVRDLREFPRSATWPSTRGQVTASTIEIDDSFSVDFQYRYRVDGTDYEGDRITFFEYAVFASQQQNQAFINAHPVGSQVEVFYDPSDPTRSVIMRSIPLSQFWSPLLLALCLGSSLFFAIVGFFVRRLWRGLSRHAGSFAGQVER